MQISEEDAAIIESALREAMNTTLDYQAGMSYRRLLTRLQQQRMAGTIRENADASSDFSRESAGNDNAF